MNADKFLLLRRLLKAIGVSEAGIDELIDRIVELLGDDKKTVLAEWPYHLRDDFLTPAEHSFYQVLRQTVSDWALVCPKVSLGDVFFVKSNDNSNFRTYTNKIDRKHVDFLLCDPHTAKPLLGIELDDKSHEREDRKARDEFLAGVFGAAELPLMRVPVKHGYSVQQLDTMLREKAGLGAVSVSAAVTASPGSGLPQISTLAPSMDQAEVETPRCPKCNSHMVIRTARSGPSTGNEFWGCTNYPRCKGTLPHKPPLTTSL